VGVTPRQAVLIPATGGTNRPAASLIGTLCRAVAVATITVAADEYGGAATRAQVAASGDVHWRSGANGESTAASAS
jgi:hypothetical protein